jgi:hypothetical protein
VAEHAYLEHSKQWLPRLELSVRHTVREVPFLRRRITSNPAPNPSPDFPAILAAIRLQFVMTTVLSKRPINNASGCCALAGSELRLSLLPMKSRTYCFLARNVRKKDVTSAVPQHDRDPFVWAGHELLQSGPKHCSEAHQMQYVTNANYYDLLTTDSYITTLFHLQ